MKTKRQKQAIEKLRHEVHEAHQKAKSNPLWNNTIPELEELAKDHKIGEVRSGWKNPYPSTDPRSLLLEYQFNSFHDKSRFKIGMQSRQSGKDFTMQGEIADDCLSRETEWMIAAPSERQSLDSLEQGKTWAEAFGLVVDDYIERREGSDSQTLLKSAEIIYRKDAAGKHISKVRAVPGKPDTVRGRSANLGLTEIDFFEKPADTWRAILPSITNPLRGGLKKVRLVSTPNGKNGLLYKLWSKKDAKIKWSKHKVTILHAVLMGLPVDLEELREMFDDAEGWLQEFLCEFLDGSSVLLPYELIGMCESSEASVNCDTILTGANALYMGMDFGRTNDPSVAWTAEDVNGCLVTREVKVMHKMSTPDQFREVSPRVAACKRVCFDYTGPGIGLGDLLVEAHGEWKPSEHKFGKVELCTFTPGLKRDMFPKLRLAFEDRTIKIPVNVEVREDLHMMQQTNSGDSYNYWSPRTKKGHSDRCTAAALLVRAKSHGGGNDFHHQSLPFQRKDIQQAMQSARRSQGGIYY